MYRLEHNEYLYLLLLIPVFIILYRVSAGMRSRALRKFGEPKLMATLIPELSSPRRAFRFTLLMLAYAFLVIGMANPQIGSRLEKVERKGIDIIIALDVSNSMLARDIKPDRLSRAKQSISRLIDRLHNDRLGVIVFAGKAYTQLPITSDYSAAKLFLSGINVDLVPTQGTAIGDAIDQAVSAFGETEYGKAIIVITDGENHEGDAISSAEVAAEKGIIVCTIGMGLPDGAPIPVYSGSYQTGFKKDKSGNTVVSRLDEVTLQQVAAAGNGIYVRASNTDAGLNKVFDQLNTLQKTEFDSKIFSDYEDRFQYFIAAGLIFLLLELLISERRSKLAKKLHLFRFQLFNKVSVKK